MTAGDALEECAVQLRALLENETDVIARMSSMCALLMQALPHASFVGFYRAAGDRPGRRVLVAGPYQGPPACLRIEVGRGVCGTCAERKESILVPDVSAFPGHIACDPLSRSELVVPVLGPDGEVKAVLDLDSREPAAFSDRDRIAIEHLVSETFGTRA